MHLRQTIRLTPASSPKFLSALGQNSSRTRPEKPGSTYNSEVNNIKRFKFKDAEGKMTDTKTVLLYFDCSTLPPQIQLGYLKFNVKQSISMPLCCFKCNRFRHIAEKCRGKERYAKCGKEHNRSSWRIKYVIAMKCADCNGNQSAASKICPKYLRDTQVLKYHTAKKISVC